MVGELCVSRPVLMLLLATSNAGKLYLRLRWYSVSPAHAPLFVFVTNKPATWVSGMGRNSSIFVTLSALGPSRTGVTYAGLIVRALVGEEHQQGRGTCELSFT